MNAGARPRLSALRWLTLSALALLWAVPSAAINTYIVNLKNGSTIISKYRPVEADFDSSMLLMMTESGHTIAISKAEIETVVSDLENRGFGTVIDTSTIIVGQSANDAAADDEASLMEDLSAYATLNSIFNITSGFSNPGFQTNVAPSAPPGSIPLSITTPATLPIGPTPGATGQLPTTIDN